MTQISTIIAAVAKHHRLPEAAISKSTTTSAPATNTARQTIAHIAHTWGGLSVAAIASATGMTPDHVREGIHRIKGILERDSGAATRHARTIADLGPSTAPDRGTTRVMVRAYSPMTSTVEMTYVPVSLPRAPWQVAA